MVLIGENANEDTVPAASGLARRTNASLTNLPSIVNTWMRRFSLSAT